MRPGWIRRSSPEASAVISPRQKRFVRQIAGLSLLPVVLLPILFGRDAELPLFFTYALYCMYVVGLLLWMLHRYSGWGSRFVKAFQSRYRGPSAFLFVALASGGMNAIPALQEWADEGLRQPAVSMPRVRGEIPAEPAVVRTSRNGRTLHLKIDNVLLNCHPMLNDPCPVILRHAGRMADISWWPYGKGDRGRVYEVLIDGHVFWSHEASAARYAGIRRRMTWQTLGVLLLITLPQLWLWRRAKQMRSV